MSELPTTRAARGIGHLARVARVVAPSAFRLTPEALVHEAQRATGLQDLGGEAFMPTLDVLLESMRTEARLNAAGIVSGREMIKLMLKSRLQLVAFEQRRPDVFERAIERPIVIVGGSRTGTTLLQRLLGALPGHRAPLLWEMTNAFVVASGSSQRAQLACAVTEASQRLLHLVNPAMKAVHFSAAREPEECVLMMGTDLQNWALQSYMRTPSYSEHLAQCDWVPSYQRHKQMLQLLQDRPGTRWVLKAPYHLPELSALLQVYPDATVVHTHRDVIETIASTASLYRVFRATASDHVDPREVGAEQTELLHRWFTRALSLRRERAGGASLGDDPNFVDVRYRDLVRDPLRVLESILERQGSTLDVATRAAAGAFLQQNKKGKHGEHRYQASDFGLNDAAIRERFADYEEAFGLR